jgi:hypothetical protein
MVSHSQNGAHDTAAIKTPAITQIKLRFILVFSF